MYHRPVTASVASQQSLRPAGSFYYDYTEEFDKPPPLSLGVEPATTPACPMPQRAGASSQPVVLRDGQLDEVADDAAAGASSGSRLDVHNQDQGSPCRLSGVSSSTETLT